MLIKKLRDDECGACRGELGEPEKTVKEFRRCNGCGCYNKVPHKIGGFLDKDSSVDVKDNALKFESLILKIKALLEGINDITLYDVCCGHAGLMIKAKERGWKARGCDVKKAHVDNARNRGLDVELCHFEDAMIDEGSLVCVMFHHGIEHVVNPRECLRKALMSIKTGGVVVMCHPCIPEGNGKLALYANRGYTQGGHGYEWTFRSFGVMVKRVIDELPFGVEIVQNLESEESSIGIERGIPPVQWWVLRRV